MATPVRRGGQVPFDFNDFLFDSDKLERMGMTTSAADAVRLSHYVAGEFVSASSRDGIPSVDPARPHEVLALIPSAEPSVVDQAVSAASEAFAAWSKLAGPARAEFLHRWSDAIKERGSELALAVAREVGKPIGEAKGEVGRCEMILRYFAGEAVRASGEVIPAQTSGSLQFSLRQPLGVIGLITPWNFPLAIPLWKAAPALAVGNTVVLKPAEASSWVAALLAETAQAAGLPSGVFNVVLGKGSTLGPALIGHEAVRGVSFTGSDTVGTRIAETCAKRNVKFQTEMGGKNVGIVLEDADMVQAANLIAGGAMRFAGQKCTATSRVVIVKEARDRFIAELRSAIDKLPFGDPLQADCAIGPVISQASCDDLQSAIERAGVKPAYQCEPVSSELKRGYFVPPTVFASVSIDSDLAQEELFGPVLAMVDAADYEEAITLANRTRFGLSASIFTKNIGKALDYVGRIEAGMVRVNGDTTGVDPHAPFGGVKGSSSGSREQGPAAKEFFTEIKTVQINP